MQRGGELWWSFDFRGGLVGSVLVRSGDFGGLVVSVIVRSGGDLALIWTQYSRQRRARREDSGDIHTHTCTHSLWVVGPGSPDDFRNHGWNHSIPTYTETKV